MASQPADVAWAIAKAIFENTVTPTEQGQVTVCYLAWVAVFLTINVIWDIRTHKTPTFHLSKMKDKATVVYDAATFTSSVLIISALVNTKVGALGRDLTIPLIIAAVSGILRAVPALCPYPAEQLMKRRRRPGPLDDDSG